MPISAFLQKLVIGASLFSQQDGLFVGNKQHLHAFPLCSAPTSKKKNRNKLRVQKWLPVVLNTRNVFKMLHFRVLYGKEANQLKQQTNHGS